MTDYPRRKFLTTLAGSLAASFLGSIHALARDIKPVKIKNVDVFRIEIPTPIDEVKTGLTNKYLVAKVETDAEVRGYAFGEFLRATLAPEPGGWEYSFDGPSTDLLQRVIRPAQLERTSSPSKTT